MSKSLLFCALALLGAASCSSLSHLQLTSAGHIGCPPEEIVITNERMGFGARAWQGSCRARTYQCSAGGSSVSCVQMLAPTALPPPAPMPMQAP